MDLVLASAGLLVAAPILLGIAVAMRRSGGRGPLLHRATRIGEDGRPFTLLKVRTMVVDHGGPRLTAESDPRVTPIGRRLRRLRLDELPQLINVIRGEMSLVGPRPEDPAYVDFSDPLHDRVFRAKPGITGLAQLEFHDEARLMTGEDPDRRYREVVLPAKLRLDAEYLDRQSLALDVRILLRTFLTVARGRRPSPEEGQEHAEAQTHDEPQDVVARIAALTGAAELNELQLRQLDQRRQDEPGDQQERPQPSAR
jgi:lipopolysaccharide/colanic/teichoic acid biosynthesis glycosyltransferase